MDNAEEYWITVRGATKLDDGRAKKQVWRFYVRAWCLSAANALHWSSCDIAMTFRRLAVIRRPPSNLAPGELCPLPPSVTPLITARSDTPQQIMVHSINQGHKGTLGFRRGKIYNSPEFLRQFEEKRLGEYCRAMVLFQKLSQKYREVFPEFFKSCPNLPHFVRL